jgi:hypothetical protein
MMEEKKKKEDKELSKDMFRLVTQFSEYTTYQVPIVNRH